MTRHLLFAVLLAPLATLAGCATDYHRDLLAAEPLGDHRFVRVVFQQTGVSSSRLFNTYDWNPASQVILEADDGWKLAITPASTTGFTVKTLPEYRRDPVIFQSAPSDRLTLIDPRGGLHPVKVTTGNLSPRPPQVTESQ